MLLAAWAIDSSRANGKVPRNVTLAGRDIGLMNEADLSDTVTDLGQHYADLKVQVRAPGETYKVPASDLGLRLDQKATSKAALGLDEDASLWSRPFTWMGSFLKERAAPLEFTVDTTALDVGLAGLAGNADSIEPKLVSSTAEVGIQSGTSGLLIDSVGVREQLLKKARSGEEPIIVNVKVIDAAPTVSDAQARALAEQLTATTANGLAVKAGKYEATIAAAEVRSWIGSEIVDGKIDVTIDDEKAVATIHAAIPVDSEKKNASITLVDNAVAITPSKDGETCCGPDTADLVLTALRNGQSEVELQLEVDKATFTTEDAEKLGIKEPVGSTTEWNGQPQVKSFTTYHPGPAPRVTNIHQMADDVRGTLVKPGEQFSINDVVGQRTAEKGYVAAGAIANGVHVDEIGGGVSQFATTMFNAAYFAGLPINTYQAHSEHFGRYPRGREATMGWPAPDLVWTNDTPYGILVWTSYTDTSLTITLWSTQHATAEQTGSSESRSGRCTVVTTERTITYPDGNTAVDNFTARYRDQGATSC
ncbi:MAG: VanW family protein [Aquihabitans sp.]